MPCGFSAHFPLFVWCLYLPPLLSSLQEGWNFFLSKEKRFLSSSFCCYILNDSSFLSWVSATLSPRQDKGGALQGPGSRAFQFYAGRSLGAGCDGLAGAARLMAEGMKLSGPSWDSCFSAHVTQLQKAMALISSNKAIKNNLQEHSAISICTWVTPAAKTALARCLKFELICSDSDQMILMICQAAVISKSVYDEEQEAKAIYFVCLPSGWAWTPQSH